MPFFISEMETHGTPPVMLGFAANSGDSSVPENIHAGIKYPFIAPFACAGKRRFKNLVAVLVFLVIPTGIAL